MYKILISFIVGVFIIALCINNCSDNVDYVSVEQIRLDPKNDCNKETTVNTNNSIESKSVNITLDYTSIEIPKCIHGQESQYLTRTGYNLSYNIKTKNPNWVAWHLTREHTDGPVRRHDEYIDDYDVTGYIPKEIDWDDLPSNFDHGHMCPAGDNKWDNIAMKETFLLSNMCPQSDRLNSGSWKKLEEKCRNWANKYGSIYIVCGPIFYSDNPETIGNAKIWIPDAFYKVILCLEGEPKTIGFIYANNAQSHSMQKCACTVDEIEELSGIDFFCVLPDEIEQSIESVANFSNW